LEGTDAVADDSEGKGSFWTSVPGILTALATLITACTGLYLALNKPLAPSNQHTRPPVTTSGPSSANSGQGSGNEMFQVRQVRVDPAKYQGHCPANVPIRGSILVEGKGNVTFRFVLSDGTATQEETRFLEQSSTEVSSVLEIRNNFNGRAQLEVRPGSPQSEPGAVEVTCLH
jgi:hypothetical protein